MHDITIYISVSSQQKHLVIDGSLELFKQFLQSLGSREFEAGLIYLLRKEPDPAKPKSSDSPHHQD